MNLPVYYFLAFWTIFVLELTIALLLLIEKRRQALNKTKQDALFKEARSELKAVIKKVEAHAENIVESLGTFEKTTLEKQLATTQEKLSEQLEKSMVALETETKQHLAEAHKKILPLIEKAEVELAQTIAAHQTQTTAALEVFRKNQEQTLAQKAETLAQHVAKNYLQKTLSTSDMHSITLQLAKEALSDTTHTGTNP